jgi:hypothetical protein
VVVFTFTLNHLPSRIPWAEARLASNNIKATTMMALIPILSELFIASASLLLYLIPEYTGRKEKASILRAIKTI